MNINSARVCDKCRRRWPDWHRFDRLVAGGMNKCAAGKVIGMTRQAVFDRMKRKAKE